jgi:hypothetical protein
MPRKILPPNDPAREDWRILNGVLGLEGETAIQPPEDSEEAAQVLKRMLATAYEQDPKNVIKRIGGSAIENCMGVLKLPPSQQDTLVAEVHARLASPSAGETEENRTVRKGIDSWDPSKSPLVSFVRSGITFAVGEMVAEEHDIGSYGPVLPANDPRRDDWKILNGFLSLEGEEAVQPPKDRREASETLKGLLKAAWDQDSHGVVTRIGGKALRHSITRFRLNSANAEDLSREIESRLENRKGRETTEKNPSNNAITSWRPDYEIVDGELKKGSGVVACIEGRIRLAVRDMMAENNPILSSGGVHRDDFRMQPLSMSSLDHIMDAGGTELSSDGVFVRQQSGVDADEGEVFDSFEIDEELVIAEGYDMPAGFDHPYSASERGLPDAERVALAETRTRYAAAVVDVDDLSEQIDYEATSRRVFGEMGFDQEALEDEDLNRDRFNQSELSELDAEDGQVAIGSLDANVAAQIATIRQQVSELTFTDPNRADIAWAINAIGGQNMLGELTPENRLAEMKSVSVAMVDILLPEHEDYGIFREVVSEFDPAAQRLSDPEYSDILEESIKADFRNQQAQQDEPTIENHPPVELIPSLPHGQLSIFDAEEKFEAVGNVMDTMQGLVKSAMSRSGLDPHDPERADLLLLKALVPNPKIEGLEEKSPARQTYLLAQAHWEKMGPHLGGMSDLAKNRMLQAHEEFDANKGSYLVHLRETLAEMQLDGLVGDSPWTAPEFTRISEGSYLGAQIADSPDPSDKKAVEEFERFERRLTRSLNAETRAASEKAEIEQQARQVDMFDLMMGGIGADAPPAPAKERPSIKGEGKPVFGPPSPDPELPSEFDGLFQSNRDALDNPRAPEKADENHEMEI